MKCSLFQRTQNLQVDGLIGQCLWPYQGHLFLLPSYWTVGIAAVGWTQHRLKIYSDAFLRTSFSLSTKWVTVPLLAAREIGWITDFSNVTRGKGSQWQGRGSTLSRQVFVPINSPLLHATAHAADSCHNSISNKLHNLFEAQIPKMENKIHDMQSQSCCMISTK